MKKTEATEMEKGQRKRDPKKKHKEEHKREDTKGRAQAKR
jgi:hypothetical protein